MKFTDLILIGGAAFAAYFLLTRKAAPTVATGTAGAQPATGAKLIGVYGGWQYFTDGTSIGPDGSYYYQGQLVYQAGG